MVKQQFYQQWSIEEAQDAKENYDDEHYKEFFDFLFDQLLINIRKISFDYIIQQRLLYNNDVYKTEEANSLLWLYTADRKLIESKTIYSFRFGNACHPEFYKTFETKAHHLFLLIKKPRHHYHGWYKYIGTDLQDHIDKYLNIQRVVKNPHPHVTKLYINQKQERLDIKFNFYSLNEQISITFEPGYPANSRIY